MIDYDETHPDARFEYRSGDHPLDDAMANIHVHWRKPGFLSGFDPQKYLADEKCELIDWVEEQIGKTESIIQGQDHYSNVWIIWLPTKQSKAHMTLFKLRWGDSYDWR